MADILAKFEAVWQAIWAWLYKAFGYWFPEDSSSADAE